MKKLLFYVLLFLMMVSFCPPPEDNVVIISTSLGDIKVKLYEKTPLHTANFVKLAKEHYFDKTLFHRVIQYFMIQGGDPDSKESKPGQLLGDGGPSYTIPFEYVPEYIHKRGVIAMGRESDDVNPEKASSGSQFYIVQGKLWDDKGLDAQELKVEKMRKKYILYRIMRKTGNEALLKEMERIAKTKDTATVRKIADMFKPQVMEEYEKTKPFKLNAMQREVYKTIGGTPHLDGSYTVFGEVISGMETIDKIAAVKTDTNDRPLVNIPMKVKLVKN